MSGMSFGQMAGLGAISAGSNLIGGVINHVLGSKQENEMWQKNYNAQKEFAQNSIQWRVQDAEKAGIHPLYAMGNSPGYTPSSSMSTGGLGDAVANAGNAFTQTMGQLQMHNAYLQMAKNEQDLKQSEIKTQSDALSLWNKVVESSMGQKTTTGVNLAHITGQGESNLHIAAGGLNRNLPGQMESEVASLPTDLAKVMDTQYNPDAVRVLPVRDKNGKQKVMMLSPLGFSSKYVKDNSELGLWDRATKQWYNWYDGLERGTKWLLKKFVD